MQSSSVLIDKPLARTKCGDTDGRCLVGVAPRPTSATATANLPRAATPEVSRTIGKALGRWFLECGGGAGDFQPKQLTVTELGFWN